MRLKASIFLLFLTWLPFASCAEVFKRLGDILQVDTRDPAHHHSSCLRLLDPNDANSVLYDPHAHPADTKHLLNKIWFWINYMAITGYRGVTSAEYNSNFETRKLLWSFFGILEDPNAPADWPCEPSAHVLDGAKLDNVRFYLQDLYNFIRYPEDDGPGKTKLFCDSTVAELQETGDELARDKYGRRIKKDNSNDFWTLREWEAAWGRGFDHNWYYWVSFGGDNGYMVLQKDDPNDRLPEPIDPRTGKSNHCAHPGNIGWTWNYDTLPQNQPVSGTGAWLKHSLIMLCPQSFDKATYNYDPKVRPVDEGTHLDDVGISALTLLHELFHVVRPMHVDHRPWFPRYVDVAQKRVDPDWPFDKSAFDDARRLREDSHNVWGALQAMTLARYELADPPTRDMDELVSLKDPEVYAWFCLTMLMLKETGQDWSTGVARAGGSDEQLVTASIPDQWPPPDKIGPMTRPVSTNSTDEWKNLWLDWELGNDDPAEFWKNTTEATGSITSFADLSTFMTSFRARL